MNCAQDKEVKVSEFGGGLGDVMTLVYTSDRYIKLEKLDVDERAMIVLMCHNPFAKELFTWHPNAVKFDIKDLGFWWPWEDDKNRKLHKLPPPQKFEYLPQSSVKFYPAPSDFKILETLSSPYVVLSAAAGGIDRNIPAEICEEISSMVITEGQERHGLKAVVVGRTYGSGKREEYRFFDRPGMINLIDSLSVPGMIELIARSRGVVCCHSAVCLISWYLKKPVFLLYPKHVQEREFNRPPHQYTFGKDFQKTMHMEFSMFGKSRFRSFIEMIAKA